MESENQINYKIVEDYNKLGSFLLVAYDANKYNERKVNKPLLVVGEIKNDSKEIYPRRNAILTRDDFKCFETKSKVYYRDPIRFKTDEPNGSLIVVLKCPCCGLLNKEYLK